MIISIGFRVNSKKVIEFRLWANDTLKQFIKTGYVLDKERLKNGTKQATLCYNWENSGRNNSNQSRS